MKKSITKIVGIVLLMSCLFSLTGCGDEEITYSVSKEEFYFSTDNGATYGNRKVEFPIGESVYMQVVVNVASSDEETHDVSGELKIPNIQAVDAYYLKGQKITPNDDKLNGYIVYPFTITTNEDWTFFFEFVPNSEGTAQMDLTFDDSVPEMYDMVNTIKFVTKKDEEPQKGEENAKQNSEDNVAGN